MEPTSSSAHNDNRKTPNHASSSEYLASQIADARNAMESTLDDLTLDVARAADLRRWVRRYPWAAVGTALVAGFTLAHVITKSKRTTIPATDYGESEGAAEDDKRKTNVEKATVRQEQVGEWRTAIVGSLFDILRLAVTQLISASVRQAQRSPRHSTPQTPSPNHSSDDESGGDTTRSSHGDHD